MADQRPQRHDLRRTRPDGHVVRPQLERLVRHRPNLAHHRRRLKAQRSLLTSDSDAAARQQTQTDHIASSTPRLVKNGPTRGLRRGRPKGVPS